MINTLWVLADLGPNNAGYHVRQKALASAVQRFGIDCRFCDYVEFFTSFPQLLADVDLIVVAKPFRAQGRLIVHLARMYEVRVVVDIFDNYSAWSVRSVEAGVQQSFRYACQLADSILVSTPYLKRVVEHQHVPAGITCIDDSVSKADINTPLKREGKSRDKWSQPIEVLQFTWFGVRANPYYSSGLIDLAAAADRIAKLFAKLKKKYRCRLTVCTSESVHNHVLLESLALLNVPVDYQAWSSAAMIHLLQRTHFALLPVNSNSFVEAKTHNRVSTAIMNDCLVLTNTHPEYDGLRPHVLYNWEEIETILAGGKTAILQKIDAAQAYLSSRYNSRSIAHSLARVLHDEVAAAAQCKGAIGLADADHRTYKTVFCFCGIAPVAADELKKLDSVVTIGADCLKSNNGYDVNLVDIDINLDAGIFHLSGNGLKVLNAVEVDSTRCTVTPPHMRVELPFGNHSGLWHRLGLLRNLLESHPAFRIRFANLYFRLISQILMKSGSALLWHNDQAFAIRPET